MTVKCDRCEGGGIILDTVNRYWDSCSCEAGRLVSEEIEKGYADVRAGRLHPWEDVRRSIPTPGDTDQ